MKIRTRLLFFLLPTMLLSMMLITSILSYSWYKEIIDSFKIKLKSAVVACARMVDPEDITLSNQDHFLFKSTNSQTELLYEDFSKIKKDLDITSLYVVFIKPNKTSFSLLEAKDLFNLKKIDFNNLEDPIKENLSKNYLLNNFEKAKDVFFTPVYKNKKTSKKILTAYAPIKDKTQTIIAYMAADMNLSIINKKISEGLLLIILISSIIIALMIVSLFIIANKITKPVHKLNNSALTLAAGLYGTKINLKGPKEITELSNTINILSECLYENINRLQENSIIKQRNLGEYECSMLLQDHMLKKTITENQLDSLAVNSINFYSNKPKGFLLDFPKTEDNSFLEIRLVEAKDEGFDGMYELLTNYKLFKENQSKLNKSFPILNIEIDKDLNSMNLVINKFNLPLIWSNKEKSLISLDKNKISLNPGDLFFIYNHGFSKLFETKKSIENMLYKVLKFFASDDLETINNMLKKEVSFFTNTSNIDEDIHLLCFQRLF